MLPLTVFLGAFLLFQVQPITGRYVLPWFGGGPMVWTICMLFFQVLLVGGYAYAHWLGSLRNPRAQAVIHSVLLAVSLLFLPLDPRGILARQAASSDPAGRILMVLAATISGPYFVLSTTGPLLQRWFYLGRPDESPWRLYSLSNLGSFLALLSYPFAVEPFFRLRTQSLAWSGLYLVFAALCGWVAWRLKAPVRRPAESEAPAARVPLADWLYWIALATCGSILLLATTNLVSQDVAVIPFLWVAPLSVYLLTFVLAFESDRWYRPAAFALAAGVLAPAGCAVMVAAAAISPWQQLAVYLAALFTTCMICHGELARARPASARLTAFYLAIAGGGALGGIFVALLCPRIFTQFSEYPVGLAGACALGFLGWIRSGALKEWTSRNLAVRLPLMALLIGAMTAVVTTVQIGNRPSLASRRNFYGILRVTEEKDALGRPFRELTHGRIRHGIEYLEYPESTWPTTYYGPHSGIGIVLTSLTGTRHVGVVGLGTGTLDAWARPGDDFRYYEINPDVVSVAKTWFSYLKDSKGRTTIILGDARVELERELGGAAAPKFDVLAVDAFSSDAIPLHLLTAECADVYRGHLAPGGLLLFHISNRVLRLDPPTRGIARHLGWYAARFIARPHVDSGESSSTWILVTQNRAFLDRPEIAKAVSPWTAEDPAPITWTDDFASLWHVLMF